MPGAEDLPTEEREAEVQTAAAAEGEVADDLDELETLTRERDEYLELARRTRADFENYRKRVAREASDAERRGVARLAAAMLPALDNLARALASEDDADLAAVIRLVHDDLVSALAQAGIEPFSPDGEPFDPTLHEAVSTTDAEGADSGTVAEVLQTGYRFGDQVLRAARVIVAK